MPYGCGRLLWMIHELSCQFALKSKNVGGTRRTSAVRPCPSCLPDETKTGFASENEEINN